MSNQEEQFKDNDLLTLKDVRGEFLKLHNNHRVFNHKVKQLPFLNSCSYEKGYITQNLSICKTCNEFSNNTRKAALCPGCSLNCHDDSHEIIEIGYKRSFRCDCGNSNYHQSCDYQMGKDPINTDNKYNHNFDNKYCYCDSAEGFTPMVQCMICEDWYHFKHLKVCNGDPFSKISLTEEEILEMVEEEALDGELICNLCLKGSLSFLKSYPIKNFVVKTIYKPSTDENAKNEDDNGAIENLQEKNAGKELKDEESKSVSTNNISKRKFDSLYEYIVPFNENVNENTSLNNNSNQMYNTNSQTQKHSNTHANENENENINQTKVIKNGNGSSDTPKQNEKEKVEELSKVKESQKESDFENANEITKSNKKRKIISRENFLNNNDENYTYEEYLKSCGIPDKNSSEKVEDYSSENILNIKNLIDKQKSTTCKLNLYLQENKTNTNDYDEYAIFDLFIDAEAFVEMICKCDKCVNVYKKEDIEFLANPDFLKDWLNRRFLEDNLSVISKEMEDDEKNNEIIAELDKGRNYLKEEEELNMTPDQKILLATHAKYFIDEFEKYVIENDLKILKVEDINRFKKEFDKKNKHSK